MQLKTAMGSGELLHPLENFIQSGNFDRQQRLQRMSLQLLVHMKGLVRP